MDKVRQPPNRIKLLRFKNSYGKELYGPVGGERQGKAMGKVGRSFRPVIHFIKCAAYIALRRYDKGI